MDIPPRYLNHLKFMDDFEVVLFTSIYLFKYMLNIFCRVLVSFCGNFAMIVLHRKA